MNFNQFVFRNTMRNKHLYMAYFLSTLFAVMVFFTFSVLAFHPALSEGLDTRVQTGMLAAAIIIYGFSFFFVLYSMDVFLQSRKKEFGLLMIQGMSPKQLRRMVFLENLVIGFFATILGSFFGIFFSQLILWISKGLMHVNLAFYFPLQAIGLTCAAFLVLFLAISFFIQFRLPKLSLQELLKAGEMGKGELKSSPIKAILAILLIGVGYGIALWAKGPVVVFVMLPVIFLVILGTYFLFNQLSIRVIQRLKKNRNLFWKKTNMMVFSDLAFRMKDNARSFFLVAVISTVAFAAIGTLYGVQGMILGQMGQTPYEWQTSGTPADVKQTAQKLNDVLAKEAPEAENKTLDIYQSPEGVTFILQSQYNELAKLYQQPEVTGTAATQIVSSMAASPELTSVKVGNQDLKVSGTVSDILYPAYQAVVVVPDNTPVTGFDKTQFATWNNGGVSYDKRVAIGKTLADDPAIMSVTYMRQQVIDAYAPVLFVGIFIGIVFFVSAGSFLYFRLYSDMESDVEKFRMVYKIGLKRKELKKMVYQQVGILFFTPIIVSLIHGAVALKAMYAIFEQPMQLEGWQVLGVFLVIQVVYYLVARIFYLRKVERLVMN